MINSRSGHDFSGCVHPSFPFLVSSMIRFPCSICGMYCSCSSSVFSSPNLSGLSFAALQDGNLLRPILFLQEMERHRQSFFLPFFSLLRIPAAFFSQFSVTISLYPEQCFTGCIFPIWRHEFMEGRRSFSRFMSCNSTFITGTCLEMPGAVRGRRT